ncbi:hypothetical protein K1T71_005803 [Dendrolimus kikuchii]|uniref:Uncharacterized protein n=1 Tax=Dendrolimus kikuchii TaxID=765133 RepID=A0ACC1D554_9NEOP|nr:hypothetical protein K1T71_005803 [Dendrolimus kikuchii]
MMNFILITLALAVYSISASGIDWVSPLDSHCEVTGKEYNGLKVKEVINPQDINDYERSKMRKYEVCAQNCDYKVSPEIYCHLIGFAAEYRYYDDKLTIQRFQNCAPIWTTDSEPLLGTEEQICGRVRYTPKKPTTITQTPVLTLKTDIAETTETSESRTLTNLTEKLTTETPTGAKKTTESHVSSTQRCLTEKAGTLTPSVATGPKKMAEIPILIAMIIPQTIPLIPAPGITTVSKINNIFVNTAQIIT